MKIGDRVIVNGLMEDKEFNNQSGIIIDIYLTISNLECSKYGIEFDNYMGGHSCNGKGKNGHCWYVDYRHLIIEDNIKDFKEELDKITL